MVKCLKCKKKLILLINLKESTFKCKECEAEYNISIKNKIIKVDYKGRKLTFFLNDISFFNSELNGKTVYELYNKGYVKCIKTLNQVFNEHYNTWELPLEDLKESVLTNSLNSINVLNQKLSNVASLEERYSCQSCGNVISFNTAVSNNFSCGLCSSMLRPFDSSTEINSINMEIRALNDRISSLNKGWC